MVLKKILHKAKVGLGVIRERGLIAFLIVALEFIQKHTSSNHRGKKIELYNEDWFNIVTSPVGSNVEVARPISRDEPLTINWLMPPPGKGSGGHMTLFRFIQALEKEGHNCKIYLHNGGPKSDIERVRAIMGDSFPAVRAPMKWLRLNEPMDEADGIFATSWETAYSVNAERTSAKKFYFVQDFEPYFYPVGSQSVLAENTYRLGLYGITAGAWLAKKLSDNYDMKAEYFNFGSDSSVYTYRNATKRKEIVFYARPYTARRGFEIGIMALDLFHEKHPEYVINIVGYDLSKYKIPFPYKNLKVLEHDDLNEVYNRCSAGLLLSLTNMSLLPLELLSSGCIPVVNDGENNRLVSNNSFITYSECNPIALANALSDVVSKVNLPKISKQASDSVKNESWEESGEKFVQIVERQIRGA